MYSLETSPLIKAEIACSIPPRRVVWCIVIAVQICGTHLIINCSTREAMQSVHPQKPVNAPAARRVASWWEIPLTTIRKCLHSGADAHPVHRPLFVPLD